MEDLVIHKSDYDGAHHAEGGKQPMKTLRAIPLIAVLALTATTAFGQGKSGGKMAMIKVNPEFAKAGTVFYVGDPRGRDNVTFKSEAPLEDIVGTSHTISGYLVFDPANPTKGGKGELQVPVASLNTGIPMRDGHLQGEAWLDAEQHPMLTLMINDVKNVKEVKSSDEYQTYDVTIVGDLTIKGKSQTMEIPGRVTYLKESESTKRKMAGDLLAARAQFDIKLADFGVTGPPNAGLIGSKVGESVTIDVSVMGTTKAPE
jgi:polyisoprenoid-binding protein YceI